MISSVEVSRPQLPGCLRLFELMNNSRLGNRKALGQNCSSVRDLVLQTYAHRIFFLSDDVRRMCNNTFVSGVPLYRGRDWASCLLRQVAELYSVDTETSHLKFPGGLGGLEICIFNKPSALWQQWQEANWGFHPLLVICLEFRSEHCLQLEEFEFAGQVKMICGSWFIHSRLCHRGIRHLDQLGKVVAHFKVTESPH